MARGFNIDNPGEAARSIERWFPTMFGVEISARQVQAYWDYSPEWESLRHEAGQPISNRTATVQKPSQVAIDAAAFLTQKGVPVEPSQIQALWNHHKQWQTSPQRREERRRRRKPETAPTEPAASGYFILNQRQVRADDEGYEDVEGHRYHWTSASSGAWKQLAHASGARFAYYRPGTASDGTAQHYFGAGTIKDITEQAPGDYVATLVDYARFERPVPAVLGPSNNHQTSILPIGKEQFDALVKLGRTETGDDELTLDLIRDAARDVGLALDDDIYAQLAAALLAGKHVILTGPPGTAKTTLAQAVADAALRIGLCAGFMPTTATADWSTYDTIGGMRPHGGDTLEFEEGHFLKAIRNDQWLLIDELNRSQFDRAFGQLFTVLSGQAVVLPYSRPGANNKPLVLLPPHADSPIPAGDVLQISENWRIIATMNVFDKSLLFEMSFALMRRFAFIEIASPSVAVFEDLIDQQAPEEVRAASLGKQLLALRELKDLGPAVFIDLTKFLCERITIQPADDGQLLFEAFYSYLLPQFEGIDAPTGERLFTMTAALMGTKMRKERLRRTLNSVLGLDLLASPSRTLEEVDIDDTADPDES